MTTVVSCYAYGTLVSMPKVVDAEQRRYELIDLTAREIARSGLERVTLREVARAGGWSTGIVSHYFSDKRDLLLATFRSRAEHAGRLAHLLQEQGAAPLDAFIDAVLPLDDDRLLNWQVWLAFWGSAIGDPELSAAQQERHDSFQLNLVEALATESAAGRLRDDVDLEHEALRLIMVLDGIAMQVVFSPDRWPEAAQRRMVQEHLAGLRP
jgi:TetR/AcrR family transcriptional regulator, transcriptional repressor of bet genes